MHRALTLIAVIIVILSTRGLFAQPAEPPKAQAKGNAPAAKAATSTATEPEKPKTKSSTDEDPVVTHHRISVDGKELKYTATAGLMPIKDAKGETEARIFYIAYTLDEAASGPSRPLMFSFNGGPGSASVWLHLGTLGPRRVTITEEPVIPPPPFRLVDNESTWLDRTDLVFIDPVGTGYSRAAKPELNAKFHGLRGDIISVGEFIRMYLARYERWASPLYLIGESYGTTRAAGLAGYLVDQGIAFNGLVLVSCALNFQGFVFNEGNDLPFLNYLPSYAATAWYHKKLPADLQQLALPAFMNEVEQWTDKDYASILARGDQLTEQERTAAAARSARYTGLSSADIDANHLRINMSYFAKELLKSQRRSIGRFNARTRASRARPWPRPASTRAWRVSAFPTPPRSTITSGPSWGTRATSPTTFSEKGSARGIGKNRWAIRRRPMT